MQGMKYMMILVVLECRESNTLFSWSLGNEEKQQHDDPGLLGMQRNNMIIPVFWGCREIIT